MNSLCQFEPEDLETAARDNSRALEAFIALRLDAAVFPVAVIATLRNERRAGLSHRATQRTQQILDHQQVQLSGSQETSTQSVDAHAVPSVTEQVAKQ